MGADFMVWVSLWVGERAKEISGNMREIKEMASQMCSRIRFQGRGCHHQREQLSSWAVEKGGVGGAKTVDRFVRGFEHREGEAVEGFEEEDREPVLNPGATLSKKYILGPIFLSTICVGSASFVMRLKPDCCQLGANNPGNWKWRSEAFGRPSKMFQGLGRLCEAPACLGICWGGVGLASPQSMAPKAKSPCPPSQCHCLNCSVTTAVLLSSKICCLGHCI